jgi:hypothetical protein
MMRNPFRIGSQMGIRKRLIFFLLVIFVPLLFLEVFIFHRWYEDRKEAELQANGELARAVARTFDSFVADVMHAELAVGLAGGSFGLESAIGKGTIIRVSWPFSFIIAD